MTHLHASLITQRIQEMYVVTATRYESDDLCKTFVKLKQTLFQNLYLLELRYGILVSLYKHYLKNALYGFE